MKQALKYGAGLIGLYLVVSKGTNAGRAMKDGASGGVSIIKALQGR